MIQNNVAKYLIMTYSYRECVHVNRPENRKVAVLVETRDCYFLPFVIKNFCHLLGEGWNFHLFVNERVRNFLLEELPHFQYHWTPLHAQRLDGAQYSSLLRQKDFWGQIKEETILIFQTDCLLLQPIPMWAETYDMIGAPCGENSSIYNGGFSLRSKKAMMQVALCREANELERRPEDVFYTQEMRKCGERFKLPDTKTAYQFATEDVYSTHPIGIHGTDKYYS